MFRWRRNADAPAEREGPRLAEILAELDNSPSERALPDGWHEGERAMFEAGLRKQGDHYRDKAGGWYSPDGDMIPAGTAAEARAKVLSGEPITRTDSELLGWRYTLADDEKPGVSYRACRDDRGAMQSAVDEERLLAKIASWEKTNLERVGSNAPVGDA
jgi:hypothetical protein